MSMFSSGYLQLRVLRAPLRVHWTAPIGVLVFSGFSLNPLDWGAIVLLMIVHELGHASLARRYHLRIVSIDITAVGGACRVVGDPTLTEAAMVAWGGVLAQGGLLVAALLARMLVHVVTGMFDGMFDILITTNAILIVLNLLPIRGLDGETAWRLFTR